MQAEMAAVAVQEPVEIRFGGKCSAEAASGAINRAIEDDN